MCELEGTRKVTGLFQPVRKGLWKPATCLIAWFFPSTGTKRFGDNDFYGREGVRAWKKTRFCGWSFAHIPDTKFSGVVVFFAVLRKDKEQGYSEPTLEFGLVALSHQDLGYYKEGSLMASLKHWALRAGCPILHTLPSHVC